MSENKRGIGIVGCGAIGSEIARAIDRREISAALTGVFDTDAKVAKNLAVSLKSKPPIAAPEELAASCNLIVEAAGVGAVAPLVELCTAKNVDLLVMSVGGLKPEHFKLFESSDSVLHIPSGAVAGIDGILALAGTGEIESLTLTTIKPPEGIKGAPYLDEKSISLDGLTGPVTVFEGRPSEAIKHFPKNINVSTTIALASAIQNTMTVRLVADPDIRVNTHEVRIVTPLGSMTMRVENKPSPTNPRTSALAYLSAIAALKKITSRVKIGT